MTGVVRPDRAPISLPSISPADHLTFGVGIHACVGQNLAKLEAQALLAALPARVRRFEIGKPGFVVNNTLHGLSRLFRRIVTLVSRGTEPVHAEALTAQVLPAATPSPFRKPTP